MTLTNPFQTKAVLVLLCGIALVAVALGAVQFLRGPHLGPSPDIAFVTVTLENGQALDVQSRELTVSQWQTCFHAGHCTLDLSSKARDKDYPATGLSYPDVMQYVRWINSHGDSIWRLPTFAEWHELAAEIMPETPDPIFTDPNLTWASTYLTKADQIGRARKPSGSFSTTSDGIDDLDGNVWEWTQDCYAGANGQGLDIDLDSCPAFIMGGEHEAVMAYLIRDPALGGCAVGAPPAHLGMRLVSDVSNQSSQ